ncbi:MAG TPA: hypothetical protein VH502_00770 [Actinoplanes sp.]
MPVSVDNRLSRSRSLVAAVLTVLILVPAGYLFYRVWQANDASLDSTRLERQGVEYVTVLTPLVSALAEAQSSALQNVSAAPTALSAAVAKVNSVDQRLGAALGTRDRWSGLRDRIDQLGSVTGNPLTVFQAYVEATNLTLALYDTVRNNSTLIRDADNDLSNLQQAVADDLPNTVVQVSRMGDLSLLVAKAQPNQQATLGPQFGAAVQSVGISVNALTDDLQAAVDDTSSPTLSGNLVTTLDSFRRGVESLTRGANPGGQPNAATMATAQSQLQSSLTSLSGMLVREMDGLLSDRLDRLNTARREALVAAGVVILLALAVLAVLLTGRRRYRMPPPNNEATRNLADLRPPGYANLIDPPYGGADLTQRERSGALR